jgi:hypothetical protein
MKTFIPIVTITAALSLPGSNALRGQALAPSGAQVETEGAQIEPPQMRQELAQERQSQSRLSGGAGGLAQDLQELAQERQKLVQEFHDVYRRAVSPGKTLIVRSSEHDPKEQANLEKDLAVMSRIFDKAIAGKPGDEQEMRKAMGIDVYWTPSSNPSPLRTVYLDGYGALFMLNVSYPLLAPPATTEEEKEKPPSDSAWQEARQELYGQAADGNPVAHPGEQYTAEKVSNLKNTLLEALKDGTNIRNLKPDDSITVCVSGGASAHGRRILEGQTRSLGDGVFVESKTVSHAGAAVHGTIMTICVKKADVDAFAKGKLDLGEFRKRASTTIYAGDAGKR